MNEINPLKVICIVDEIDAKAIEKGYYSDLKNTKDQKFVDINNIDNWVKQYGVEPKIGEVYAYDTYAQDYVLMNPSIEKQFSQNKIEAYITTLGYMGATSIKGKIFEVEGRELTQRRDGSIGVKLVKTSATVENKTNSELKQSLEIERKFKVKSIKSYEEIKEYLESRGIQKDQILQNRLEELRFSPTGQLHGTYSIKTELTQNLTEILEIGYNLSMSYFFSTNVNFNETCSSYHKIDYELEISFD